MHIHKKSLRVESNLKMYRFFELTDDFRNVMLYPQVLTALGELITKIAYAYLTQYLTEL